MKKLLFCLFTICVSAFESQNLKVESPIRFLALGDSYTIGESVSTTQRWPVQLLDSLVKRQFVKDTLQIIATTGWRTDNLISAISGKQLAKKNFNLVALLIGVNNQYQGKNIAQYKKEFPQLLDSAIRFAGGDKSRVFVVSIPDYAYTPFGQQSQNPAQISTELDLYNALNKHYADSAGITYFDITPISRQGVAKPQYVAGDGLHPSGAQYSAWVKLMLQHIDMVLTPVKEQKKSPDLIKFFPNPTTEKLTISNGSDSSVEVEVSDVTGQILMKFIVPAGESTISVGALEPAIYFTRCKSGNFSQGKRFVKGN